jgi:hypothetical protein
MESFLITMDGANQQVHLHGLLVCKGEVEDTCINMAMTHSNKKIKDMKLGLRPIFEVTRLGEGEIITVQEIAGKRDKDGALQQMRVDEDYNFFIFLVNAGSDDDMKLMRVQHRGRGPDGATLH